MNSQIFDVAPPYVSKCGNYIAMPHGNKYVALVDGKQARWFNSITTARQFIDQLSKTNCVSSGTGTLPVA
jgi:hypothetical protein